MRALAPHSEDDVEARLGDVQAIVRESRIALPSKHRRALEAAAAYAQSEMKLAFQSRVTRKHHATKGTESELSVLLLDHWPIGLQRHLDALQALCEATRKLVPVASQVPAIVADVKQWTNDRGKEIERLRSPVAHANTRLITEVSKKGVWEGMIVFDLLGAEALAGMFREDTDADRARFKRWSALLLLTTDLLTGKADEFCEQMSGAVRSNSSARE